LTKGQHTFHVKNRGSQAHAVSLVRLDPDASVESFVAALAPGAAGPLPGTLVGGITGLESGGEGAFTANLSPGRYGMICLFTNPDPHLSHALLSFA
jgi:hypothetical protein